MSVGYKLVERGNPQKPEEPKKTFAIPKAKGEITFRQLCKEIATGSTTVSDTDVMAVINDVIKLMVRHLANGEIVRLGDFGSFQISFGSAGAENADKFTTTLIRSPKIAFRSGIDLREMLAVLKYEKTV